MDESSLDIVHSVTIKRKPKKVLIPESVFTTEFHPDSIQSKENCLPNLMPWRVTSSNIVARVNPQVPQNQTVNESTYFQNETLSSLSLPKTFKSADGLRTPFRKKSKNLMESDSTMTRYCEELFSRMAPCKENKPEIHADPCPSVRRIIKGSGLLKAFGTGLVTEDELDDTPSPTVQSETTEQENVTEHDLTESSSLEHDDVDRNDESESSQPENGSNSFQLFSSDSIQSPQSSLYFDTVVLQKTVETEFVEYLPPKNYQGFQLFSNCDYKRTCPEPSSMESPNPTRKKRPRFDDHLIRENFMFR